MKVTKQKFGLISDGSKVNLYTVKNDFMSFSCTDYGCTLTSIVLKNSNGSKTDILLGYSTLEGYINSSSAFGGFVGRFANRISKSSFNLDGIKYNLDKNDGVNSLHGGFNRYEKQIWKAKVIENENYAGVKFTRTSPDGEQGFPGNLEISVTYLLDKLNNLSLTYTAQTDKATPVNLTNHAYFNLAGNGSIENHTMQMNSSKYLEVSPKLIPTGKILDVKDTAFDFTKEKKIGKDIKATGDGYDHCYVTEMFSKDNPHCGLPLDSSDLVYFCTVKEPLSGHEMQVFTNQEGCQFYTENFIKGITGKNGWVYNNHEAFCLETQCFPDTPNRKEFPSCILEPGQKMKVKTVYSFK